MKIAIVHDYLNQFGGAERCVAAMLEAFPNADLYTSFYVPEDTFATVTRPCVSLGSLITTLPRKIGQ